MNVHKVDKGSSLTVHKVDKASSLNVHKVDKASSLTVHKVDKARSLTVHKVDKASSLIGTLSYFLSQSELMNVTAEKTTFNRILADPGRHRLLQNNVR